MSNLSAYDLRVTGTEIPLVDLAYTTQVHLPLGRKGRADRAAYHSTAAGVRIGHCGILHHYSYTPLIH